MSWKIPPKLGGISPLVVPGVKKLGGTGPPPVPMVVAPLQYSQYSSFWQYTLFLDIRRLFLQECRQTVVKIDKFAAFPFLYIFESFRNNVGINCTL